MIKTLKESFNARAWGRRGIVGGGGEGGGADGNGTGGVGARPGRRSR